MDLHSAVGRETGLTSEDFEELAAFADSERFTERETLALEYAEHLTRTPAEVPDVLFERLREHFGEAQLVEMTALVAWENYRARFNRGFDVGAQGFSQGSACPIPAREESAPA